MLNVNINKLADEIAQTLTNHGQKIQKGMGISAEKVAKKVIKTLEKTSPKKTGNYSKAWTSKHDENLGINTNYTVFNKEGYLTHLLEDGHANRDGGRTAGIPHIRPAEEMAIAEFIKEVEGVIENADG